MRTSRLVWVLVGLWLYVIAVVVGVGFESSEMPTTMKTYHVVTASTPEALFLEADWP